MTLTLELSPETESRLRAVALEKGASLEAVALKRLNVSLLSEEELEVLEDECDIAAAHRAREEDDPTSGETQAMTPAAVTSRYAKNVFEAVAKERDISFEEIVALYPDPSEDLLEELEDEVDGAEAERRMANSDPSGWKTLDDWRKALGR